jgi:hypothetical protein
MNLNIIESNIKIILAYYATSYPCTQCSESTHGKNFGGVFFDVFCQPEFESEVRITIEILGSRDCIRIKNQGLHGNVMVPDPTSQSSK